MSCYCLYLRIERGVFERWELEIMFCMVVVLKRGLNSEMGQSETINGAVCTHGSVGPQNRSVAHLFTLK